MKTTRKERDAIIVKKSVHATDYEPKIVRDLAADCNELEADRANLNAKLDAEMATSAGLRERVAMLEDGGLRQKPFLYALAEIDGTPFLDEGCVSTDPDCLDIEGSELNILPVYTGPQVFKMVDDRDAAIAERDRLQSQIHEFGGIEGRLSHVVYERDALAAKVKELEQSEYEKGREIEQLRAQIAAATSEDANTRAYDAFVEAYERGCSIAYSIDVAMAAANKVEIW